MLYLQYIFSVLCASKNLDNLATLCYGCNNRRFAGFVL
jgi:hypothetical protein